MEILRYPNVRLNTGCGLWGKRPLLITLSPRYTLTLLLQVRRGSPEAIAPRATRLPRQTARPWTQSLSPPLLTRPQVRPDRNFGTCLWRAAPQETHQDEQPDPSRPRRHDRSIDRCCCWRTNCRRSCGCRRRDVTPRVRWAARPHPLMGRHVTTVRFVPVNNWLSICFQVQHKREHFKSITFYS